MIATHVPTRLFLEFFEPDAIGQSRQKLRYTSSSFFSVHLFAVVPRVPAALPRVPPLWQWSNWDPKKTTPLPRVPKPTANQQPTINRIAEATRRERSRKQESAPSTTMLANQLLWVYILVSSNVSNCRSRIPGNN
jgi:hypothetical protein